MSSGTTEPRFNRRTVTMDETKVIREVVQESAPHTISQPPRTAPVEPPPVHPYRPDYQTTHHRTTAQQTTARPPEPPPNLEQSYALPEKATVSAPVHNHHVPHAPAEEWTVLVINASQSMAHEITLELSRTLPGATILFAPTLNLALWILKRRNINLILSSSILPDGALGTLHQFIELMSPPPELVVMSDLHSTRAELGSHPGYRFVELRRVSTRQNPGEENHLIARKISELGANIRNDLNNPLQEIVAMAFVAHSSQGLSPMAEEALSAIQRAAGNMADVVNMLEDKIRYVVTPSVA